MRSGDDSGIVNKLAIGRRVGDFSRVSGLDVCYWNVGGGLLKRLKANPSLGILEENPDILVYRE